MHEDFLFPFSFWGHAAAAFGYAALAVWLIHRGVAREEGAQRWLLGALGATALWALAVLQAGMGSTSAGVAECARNALWAAFTFKLLSDAGGRARAIDAIYAMLALVLALGVALQLVSVLVPMPVEAREVIALTVAVMRMIFAAGALLIVHNVYILTAPEARGGIALPLLGLAAIWIYDLNLYTVAYLGGGLPSELAAARGFAVAAMAPLFVAAARRGEPIRLQLSRSVAFRATSLVVIAGYLAAMMVLAVAVELVGGQFVRLAQLGIVFAMSIGALLVVPSARFRGWLKVIVAKHFFQHRYDYRGEWMRFTETIGRPSGDGATLPERAVQAVADICDCPAGLMFLPDAQGRLALEARWNWHGDVPVPAFTSASAPWFQDSGYIAELDGLRRGTDTVCDPRAVPQWLYDSPDAWAIVPCVHFGRLAGLVVLARPRLPRRIDWEDLDMLRTVGRQVASYLSEARSQSDLAEARQFDEFNRRFAFIMHDIKNLVSQLSLLSRNAERHADNPEFRADMIETLKSSVGRMNELLARLSQHNKGKTAAPAATPLAPILRAHPLLVAHGNRVVLKLDDGVVAVADPARVQTILSHLVQNAIEASAADTAVTILLRQRAGAALIDVVDQGAGMDEAFVRAELFKPFSSTKAAGFGIGAYESRTLAEAMGGRLEVDSRPGRGTRFQLTLPLAETRRDTDTLRTEAA